MADENEVESIAEFSEDISTAERPEPLPAGEYPATIMAAQIALSKKNTRYAAVTFQIEREAFPADYAEAVGPSVEHRQFVYRRLSLEDNPQARFNLRQFCEAIGAPMSKTIRPADWVGYEGQVGIDHEVYEGVKRDNIRKVSKRA